MIRCPKCNYFKVATERRPDGNSKCIACQYEAPTKEFEVKNWDWIDQETQKQLDKLKSISESRESIINSLISENAKQNSEIEHLKSKLKVAASLIKCNETFHRLGGIDDCEPCLFLKEIES